jgi:hypothetical protein
MATRLSDPVIQELSVVFGNLDGKEYAPRNEEARVLSVKGGERGLVSKAVEALKAYFASNNDLVDVRPYPVSEAEDNIDNDGDGPEDYNQICYALCGVYNDISQAWCINDDSARSAAIVKAIDSFLLGLDALRAGDDSEKAGARHSASDKAHIAALKDAHAKMAEHLAALDPEADKAKEQGQYGDVAYADEKNKKYPIDTEEHARAAWSYINQEKNAAEYSADELSTIKDRIRAACKKFGIEINDDGKKAGEVEMTQEEINALVADAAAKAAEAAVAKAQEAAQAQIDAAKAEAKAQAEAEAQAKIDAAKADAEKAAEAQRAAEAQAEELKTQAIKAARAPSGGSTQPVQPSSSLQAAVKAALAGAGSCVI